MDKKTNIIPKTTIIELNANNAENATGNSWTNTIDPITIYEGDQISLKQMFIDVGGEANADINVIDDVTITLEFGFYIINGPEYDKILGRGDLNFPDGQEDFKLYYVAVNPDSQSINPPYYGTKYQFATKMRTFTIPKGAYSNSDLAELVTNQISQALPNDPAVPGTSLIDAANFFSYFRTAEFIYPDSIDCSPLDHPGFKKDFYTRPLYRFVEDEGQPQWAPDTGPIRFIQNMEWDSNFYVFDCIPQGTNASIDYGSPINIRYVMMGSAEVALVYDNINDVFKFNMFTPPYSSDKKGTWVARIRPDSIHDGSDEVQCSLTKLATTTGNFIVSIKDNYLKKNNDSRVNPNDLFFSQVLGFDVPNMCIDHPFDDGGTYLPPKSIWPVVSQLMVTQDSIQKLLGQGGQWNSQQYYGQMKAFDNNGFYEVATTDVETPQFMQSKPLNTVYTGGHFLLSISSIPQTKLIGANSDANDCGLTAIVSRAYTDSNTVTVYGDSAPVYVHKGNPVTIDQFDVKILDPDTKQPTSFLSNKGHCIYLEIINY